jgi:hypothetical protein
MRTAVARRNSMLDAIRTALNSGFIRIYSGTRPTDSDTALSGNTLLAQCTFNATAFPASSGGVITANAITGDASADATGTATFARLMQSDGTTPFADISVSASGGGGELQLSTTSIVAAVAVSVTSLTITAPVGT